MKEVSVLKSILLPVCALLPNDGQIPGLPKNPRKISMEKMRKLKESIKANPEMLALREILVCLYNEEYIVIGGNQRLQALKELGIQKVPCKLIPKGSSPDELRAYLIKDNIQFGSWIDDMLTEDWDIRKLIQMGMDEAKQLQVIEHTTEIMPKQSISQQTHQSSVQIDMNGGVCTDRTEYKTDSIPEGNHDNTQERYAQLGDEPIMDNHDNTEPNTNVIEDQVGSATMHKQTQLQQLVVMDVCGIKIPLTTEENERLLNSIEVYKKENGGYTGYFVERLNSRI